MNPHQPGYDAQMDRVMGLLEHHMKAEEEEFLPQLKKSCWETELVSLGDQFKKVEATVPTHPHPWAPDRPPFEKYLGMFQAVIDRTYDAVAREFPPSVIPGAK